MSSIIFSSPSSRSVLETGRIEYLGAERRASGDGWMGGRILDALLKGHDANYERYGPHRSRHSYTRPCYTFLHQASLFRLVDPSDRSIGENMRWPLNCFSLSLKRICSSGEGKTRPRRLLLAGSTSAGAKESKFIGGRLENERRRRRRRRH